MKVTGTQGRPTRDGDPFEYGDREQPRERGTTWRAVSEGATDLAMATELQERYAPDARAALDDSMYVLTAARLAER